MDSPVFSLFCASSVCLCLILSETNNLFLVHIVHFFSHWIFIWHIHFIQQPLQLSFNANELGKHLFFADIFVCGKFNIIIMKRNHNVFKTNLCFGFFFLSILLFIFMVFRYSTKGLNFDWIYRIIISILDFPSFISLLPSFPFLCTYTYWTENNN